ncbi:prephenate dehydrogenase [Clostridia bacterium]|nr:prephenate dehydrogenase [Clostridia bacterium]
MEYFTAAFIGLGLIGGSLAQSIRYHYPQSKLYAYDTDSHSLQQAKQTDCIQEYWDTLDERLQNCDYLFLAAPVLVNCTYLKQIQPFIQQNCIICDLSSTKNHIQQEAKKLGLQAQFIGGHPMAGIEKSGFSYANKDLFKGAYFLLTAEPEVSVEKKTRLTHLLDSLNTKPLFLSAKEHDLLLANISHLPHIVAASLVHIVQQQKDPENIYQKLAAGGFRDITRIASSSPELWTQVCLSNKEPILSTLKQYQKQIQDLQKMLQEENIDDLNHFFQVAKDYRDSI